MSAIVMTVWSRHHLLRRVLSAWSRVRGVSDWRFVFMVEPSQNKSEILGLIDEFEHPNKEVVENYYRLGVLSNPHAGLSRVFGYGEDFVILAEEDLVPSSNVLEYFSYGRDLLVDDSEILAVCAHGVGDDPSAVVIREKFSVWLWGTWRDRWYKYLSDTWDHDYSTGVNKVQAGWDWNIELRVRPSNGLKCLHPQAALVDHIGIVGSHMTPQLFVQSRPIGFQEERPFNPFQLVSEQ